MFLMTICRFDAGCQKRIAVKNMIDIKHVLCKHYSPVCGARVVQLKQEARVPRLMKRSFQSVVHRRGFQAVIDLAASTASPCHQKY